MKQRVRTALAVASACAATGGVLVAGIGSAAADDRTGCSTGRLPNVVVGSPGLKPGQATGVYLWHTGNGYALRATHPGSKRVVFSGTLTASNRFSRVRTVAYEKADTWSVSKDAKTLTFRFTNYGGIDGLDFAASCARTLRVAIRVDGSTASPRQVKLGARRANPTSNPFTIQRSRPAPQPSPSASASPSGTPSATPSATSTATIG